MPTYSKAPVAEAVIGIGGTIQGDLADLQDLSRHLPPHKQSTITSGWAQFQFDMSGEVKTSSQRKPIGVRYDLDASRVLQVRLDGFFYSVLPPYSGWETFRDEARRAWHHYLRAARQIQVSRLAVRYINQFHLPMGAEGGINIGDYLKVYPEVPSAYNPAISSFLMQLQVPQEDIGATLILNQSTAKSKEPNAVAITLDCDLFKSVELSIDTPDSSADESLWSVLERLRERKNIVFEASITEKTRTLIA